MRCKTAESTTLILILWTIPIVARRCRLIEPRAPTPWEGEELWDGGVQQSHIDGVIEAAQALISQAYPSGVPSNVNLQTAAWPSSFDIGGTTYTGIPSRTAAPSSTVWWTQSSSNAWSSTTATATTSASSSPSSSPTRSSTSRPTTSLTTKSSTFSSTSRTSSRTSSESTSSRTSTSATRTSSSTLTATSDGDEHKHSKNDGDRKVAIALGILFVLPAVALAAAIFYALWRRKRQTGSYFKATRDSGIAPTPTTSSIMWGGAAGSVSPGGSEPTVTVGSRSWFGGAASGPARNNSLRANFPEMTESAEKLPMPVEAHTALVTEREIPALSSPYLLAASRGHLRLQKSHSSMQRGVPKIIDPAGLLQPHELEGDDLAVLNELDAGMPRPASTPSTRTASSLRRLSSFPFVLGSGVPSGIRANWDYAAGVLTRSSSANTKGTSTASELDAESTSLRQRQNSLRRLSVNPFIMAQLAEAEPEFYTNPAHHVADTLVSRSDSGNAGPSEMDGESPTRRASTWRELHRSTFTVNDLETEIEGFNALFDELESGSSTDDSSPISGFTRGVPPSTRSPTSTLAFTEVPCSSIDDNVTSPTASTSPQEESSSGEKTSSEYDAPIGFVSTSRGTTPVPEIKTTELILPPRPPMPVWRRDETASIISPVSLNTPPTTRSVPVSPLPPGMSSPLPPGMSDRDYILNRARYGCPKASPKTSVDGISPPLPAASSNNNKPAWAPAGAYAAAPIWRKKRPAPLDPNFLSPMASPTPPHSGELGSNNPFNPSLLRKSRSRPQPLTPDWLPESLRAGSRQGSSISEEESGEDDNNDNREREVKQRHDNYSAYCPGHDGHAAKGGLSVVAKELEHYPSWSEISAYDFDFNGKVESGDGGWRPGGTEADAAKYEMML